MKLNLVLATLGLGLWSVAASAAVVTYTSRRPKAISVILGRRPIRLPTPPA
jgi:type IV secretory pathway TrbD component